MAVYIVNGIMTAFLWAMFFRPELNRRQITIKSLCVLTFMEAVSFAALKWLHG